MKQCAFISDDGLFANTKYSAGIAFNKAFNRVAIGILPFICASFYLLQDIYALFYPIECLLPHVI